MPGDGAEVSNEGRKKKSRRSKGTNKTTHSVLWPCGGTLCI